MPFIVTRRPYPRSVASMLPGPPKTVVKARRVEDPKEAKRLGVRVGDDVPEYVKPAPAKKAPAKRKPAAKKKAKR